MGQSAGFAGLRVLPGVPYDIYAQINMDSCIDRYVDI